MHYTIIPRLKLMMACDADAVLIGKEDEMPFTDRKSYESRKQLTIEEAIKISKYHQYV